MKSKFQNHKRAKCGSDDLAHVADWYSDTIPVGITGFIGCRGCQYWESLLSVNKTEDIFDGGNWIVIEAGQGTFDGDTERQKTITYRDPDADQYPRYGITQ